jgi:hypothetical protein
MEPVNDLKIGVSYPLLWLFFQAKMGFSDNFEE